MTDAFLDLLDEDPLVVTVEDADKYFSPDNHSRAADWKAIDEPTRRGALAQAVRELTSYTNRILEAPEPSEPVERDDWAVFEQALEILDRQPRQTATSKVKKIGKPQEDERRGFRISPVALSFLRIPRLRICRG